MIREVAWLAVVLRRPPEADRAPGPRQVAIGDEPGQRAADLEQTRAATGVIVHRLLSFLQMRGEHDVLIDAWIGAANYRLHHRHPRFGMGARAELGTHDGVGEHRHS